MVGVFTEPEPSTASEVVPFTLAHPSHRGYVFRGMSEALTDGEVYYAVVMGINIGFTIATRPAVFVWNYQSGPILPGVWSSVLGTKLSAGWIPPIDPETRHVTWAEWAVGTDPAADPTTNDVMDWKPLPHIQATTASQSGLAVWHNTPYWITVRSGNQFGEYGEASARLPLRVDLTPPEAGMVAAGSWEYFQYVLEDAWFPDQPPYWDGVLACVNDLNQSIANYSDCVCALNDKIMDKNCELGYGPPLCPAPADRPVCAGGRDLDPMCRLCHWNPNYRHRQVWYEKTEMAVLWYSFEDPDSRIAKYEVAMGTQCGFGRENNIMDWVALPGDSEAESAEAPWQFTFLIPEELELEHNNEYYVSVRATNVNLLATTACSAPVLVDRTPPRFIHGPVHSEIIGQPKIWFHGDIVNVTWGCFDDESEIGYQEICIGTDPRYLPESVQPCTPVSNRSGTQQFEATWQESQVRSSGSWVPGHLQSPCRTASQACASRGRDMCLTPLCAIPLSSCAALPTHGVSLWSHIPLPVPNQ